MLPNNCLTDNLYSINVMFLKLYEVYCYTVRFELFVKVLIVRPVLRVHTWLAFAAGLCAKKNFVVFESFVKGPPEKMLDARLRVTGNVCCPACISGYLSKNDRFRE